MKRTKRIIWVCALLALLSIAFLPLPAAGHAQSLSQANFSPQAAHCPSCPKAPHLVSPKQNAKIQQNNPSIGCPFDPTYGYGDQIYFDWTPSLDRDGIDHYDLLVQQKSAKYPLINTSTTASNYLFTECNGFVADVYLTGWTWSVRAVDKLGNVGPWKTRKFSYKPCRLADGTACFSHAP
jgi:hypothetical protein